MWLTFDAVACGHRSPVLTELSFRLGSGLWVLCGPNGSGKSTLLCCAAGILPPLRGRLVWNGQDAYALGSRYRWHVGYMPQEPLEYADLTARKLLLYLASLKGIRPALQDGRVQEVLRLTGLEGSADRPAAGLSAGMQTRLSLAQALLNDPDILLLDEPTPGLDPQEGVGFRNLIQDLARDRIVLVATNIPEEVAGIARGVLRLGRARLGSDPSNGEEVFTCGDFDLQCNEELSGRSPGAQ